MQNPLKRSQKFMLYAYVLVFVAQFFYFGSGSYFYTTRGGGFTLYNEAKVNYNGWYYHSWWFVLLIMAVVLYTFYNRSPKVGWYWAAFVVCILLGFGGILGFVSMIVAGYAVYLKRKEDKVVAKTQ